ncbi:hypothetical protein PHYBLDRAFT_160911 [Phycomyces blakesleeanus NRRL 1555(-)]|uniref:Reverse transcriptase domain-containing protein n=1 Tax=Phycomyces blakesleeanus (strain ATCC 8743b / DSM 1359 / FGSC 10004 / NBRC 33097 / NRRL 1555) TaxID=763407 RepID=A0A163CRF2_PHYB8|nr:hypothetical protein PHYBLDRAFT_160911 [Phycomyces blakesleeanus NRRL 1555(-)]OAD65060.1 hypothetical protein PHYBLDRAFT_160911 [Phycomyces blakesleeanus NRRL 1555(-)]|eukprot:XP_018283100.1 hypothetical protein PHYBLDRAFT_160911 [Phycomyces blakesleeanus NRRL 1555(-)]
MEMTLVKGVIRPSNSLWSSPLILVPKPGNTHIDDLLHKLIYAKYFLTLDLKSGYWQIPMSPGDICNTTSSTEKSLFEFHLH